MKKWFRFIFLGFFSHSIAKEGAKRGYINTFLCFVLALIFIWAGSVGGYMLPFGVHYANSPDFMDAAHMVFANTDADKRIDAEVEDGRLNLRLHGGEYTEGLLVNTLESAADKEKYSTNDYDIVVDSRPADTLAEVEAYCVSNDGKETVISYADYLTLSDVARLNFDFKLRYTGNELVLNDELVEGYRVYVDGISAESGAKIKKISADLSEGKITKTEYNRAIYELYFVNYYPDIIEYESSSRVPLLRNYYFYQYISKGVKNYLFIFDDYMAGCFTTGGGAEISFYGFYSGLENGALVKEGATVEEANVAVDEFINNSFGANWVINSYACLANTITLAPFIALMLFVATLLTYSILKLLAVDSISSIGAMLNIIGSFVLYSGFIAAVLSLVVSFFVNYGLMSMMPSVLFFIVLVSRAIIFAVKENRLYHKQLEQSSGQTEV